MTATRIPFNLFGIPFGLAGLAGTWLTVADFGHAPVAVANILLALSALSWVILVAFYVRYVSTDRTYLHRDLFDPIGSPFASLIVITPMLLASEGIFRYEAELGRFVFNVFLVLTVLLGGWFTGDWIYGELDIDKFHPGYFLPTVAGGLVASLGASDVGEHRLAMVMLGFGVISWLVVGSLVMGRMFFRPALPTPLIPALAIQVAPSAVGSLAYLATNGDRLDGVAALLAGYGVLMILAQLRMIHIFAKLPFMPSTWAFTFSWAAAATASTHWLNGLHPVGFVAYEYAVLAAITLLIGGIFVRTLVALARRNLLLRPVVAASFAAPETVAIPVS